MLWVWILWFADSLDQRFIGFSDFFICGSILKVNLLQKWPHLEKKIYLKVDLLICWSNWKIDLPWRIYSRVESHWNVDLLKRFISWWSSIVVNPSERLVKSYVKLIWAAEMIFSSKTIYDHFNSTFILLLLFRRDSSCWHYGSECLLP